MKHKFKIGDTVEYNCICGIIHCQILKVKDGGKLILNTGEKEHKILNKTDGRGFVKLSKNVCVMPHRIKQIK